MNCVCLKSKKDIFEDIVYHLCVVIAFVLLCINLWTCSFYTIWNDEAYSIGIMNHSYLSLIVNVAGDVHPPLYYLILKFLADPLCAIFPFISQILIAKFVSMIAFIALFYFAVHKLSKVLPKTVVGLFLLSIFCFASLKDLTTSIRMYSFATLFVVVQFYYFVKIIKFGETKKDWWKFILFFELSAYSHNFSLVASGLLFVFLIVFYFIKQKEKLKQSLKYLLYAALIYLPWFAVLIFQMVTIQNNYWIDELTLKSVMHILEYFLVPAGLNLSKTATIVWVFASIFVYLVMFIFNILNKKLSIETKWIISAGYFVALIWFLFGIIFSVLINPILVERYTDVLIYIFYLSVCLNFYYFFDLVTGYFKSVKIQIIVPCVMAILSCVTMVFAFCSTIFNFKDEQIKNEYYYENCKLIESTDNAIIMLDDINTQTMFDGLYQKYGMTYSFGYQSTWWENIQQVQHKELTSETIKDKLGSGEVVLYFTFNENNISKLENEGVLFEFVGKTIIGTSNVKIYKLSL